MRNARAIVTLVIGGDYLRPWQLHCRANWEQYARRHGFDLIPIDVPLDTSARALSRSAAWQKLLILSHPSVRDYEQVLWLDADILIHPQAPSVFEGVPPERVGAIEEFSNPTAEIYQQSLRKWVSVAHARGEPFRSDDSPRDFYRAYGFEDGFDQVVHTGVMVLSPRHHRELLEHVYFQYEDVPGQGMLMEMRPLSYELMRRAHMHWLDPRFNLVWIQYKAVRFPFLITFPDHPMAGRCLGQAFAESYFMHFAGGALPELARLDSEAPLPRVPRPWTRRRDLGTAAVPRCEAPVALILFNRPATTARVFEAIRAARPRQLFLIADGPRAERPEEAERCAASRAAAAAVDWDCEVRTNFAAANLGLKQRVDTGLDWLFEQVEEAVILEDDCLPDPSFFRFCAELLGRYRDESRVMTISGSDFKFGLAEGDESYTFSRYPLIWGWATWRRAWQRYDGRMSEWPRALEDGWLRTVLDDARAVDYWEFLLQQSAETLHTWDYAWVFCSWLHDGLSIHPNRNLVSNIGFGADAVHTHDRGNALSDLPVESMPFPLRHPAAVRRDEAADRLVEQSAFSGVLDQLWLRLRARQARRRRQLGR